jgi:phage terminase Nu1 subunit (DNA packaging protein)
LDATTLGAALAFAGVASGSVVAYIGKRGETGLTRANSLTDQLQEELTRKTTDLATAQADLAALQQQRRDYLIEITRLQIKVIQLGGDPTP